MANESIISLPPDLSDPVVVRRVLSKLIEILDVTIGARGSENQQYVSQANLTTVSNSLTRLVADLQQQQMATTSRLDKLEQALRDALVI